jgi:hypothetical protein
MDPWYETELGVMHRGYAEDVDFQDADLVFTSPPWRPGTQRWYVARFAQLASRLTAHGSLVVVLGNDWAPPFQTVRTLETLKRIVVASGLDLAQMFVAAHDRALMSPSVADRMNDHIGRTRVPDVHSHAWWLTRNPKVSSLYAACSGSVVDATTSPADWRYEQYCLDHGLDTHPAAMPFALPAYFVKLLTEPGDLVVDPFAGSNTTGAAAEYLGRRWLSVEPDERYVAGSRGRFPKVREHV